MADDQSVSKNVGNTPVKIIVISDGTGETAKNMARAALSQFTFITAYFTIFKNVRSKDQMEAILNEAMPEHDLIVFTIVTPDLRDYLIQNAYRKKIRIVDLMGPLLTTLSNMFEKEPNYSPGVFHAVNDDYFKRVEAIEFTLNHDDGKNLESLMMADVILLGISRTSKTPLSIYLSLEGLKVVNIPMILNVPLPEAIQKVDQRKIFCLTIDPDALFEIRQNRLNRLGLTRSEGEYAEINKVMEEIEWANKLFSQNKRWPVFNITGKALEETASDIVKILQSRKSNPFIQG